MTKFYQKNWNKSRVFWDKKRLPGWELADGKKSLTELSTGLACLLSEQCRD